MNNAEIIFQDRKEAGQKLAELLQRYAAEKPIILGMPRGGVVVAYEIAKILKVLLDFKDKVVIIVDDGVATGQTAIVAIRSVCKLELRKIIFACGVCARDAAVMLRQETDEVICLSLPEIFYAVGQWYLNFAQTTDAEVLQLLKLAEQT